LLLLLSITPFSGEYDVIYSVIRPKALPQVQWISEKTLVVSKERRNRHKKSATPNGHVQRRHSAKRAQLDCSIMAAELFCGIGQMAPHMSLGGRDPRYMA
jgi:hypothetical protein